MLAHRHGLTCLLIFLLGYKGNAQGTTTKPLMVVVNAGGTQSFLDISSSSILSASGQLSPLFSASVFQYKPGLAPQLGIGIVSHRFAVETISAADRAMNFVYLDIPLAVRYGISPSFGLSAGGSAAVNVGANADFDLETGRPEQTRKKISDTASGIVGNMKFSASYLSRIGLSFQVTYSKAVSEILKDGSDGKTFSYVDIQLGYILFGHQHHRANDRLRNAGPKNGWK